MTDKPALQESFKMWYSYISIKLKKDSTITAQVTTDRQSPWFEGHFPNDPILPGIAQIHMVTETIAKALQKDLSLQSLTRIKFKKIIRPGDILDIHAMAGKTDNQYSFRITSKKEDVCSGRLMLAPTQEQQRIP